MLWLEQEAPAGKSINMKQEGKEILEDDIVVLVLTENVCRLFLLFGGCSCCCCLRVCCCCLGRLLAGCKDLCVCSSNISLFLSRDLLETIEFLAIKLIKFGVNVFGELAIATEPGWQGYHKHLIVFSVRGMITCSLCKVY